MRGKFQFGRALLAAIGAAFCVSGSALALEVPEGAEIAQGVYADDVNLSGMTLEEAKAAVADRLALIQGTPLTITFGGTTAEDGTVASDKTLLTTFGEMGVTCLNPEVIEGVDSIGKKGSLLNRYKELKDLECVGLVFDLQYQLDEALVTDFVTNQSAPFNEEVVEATIKRKNNKFVLTEDRTGMVVDTVGTIASVLEAGKTGSTSAVSVVATVTETLPTYTYEMLSTIKDRLGDAHTTYSGDMTLGRNINLRTGTRYIDGTVILPGETFSANGAMEPYTEARGWDYGGSFAADGTVEQTLGGGICQISSTLYNAVLEAEVEIAQRNNHSMTVGYLPVGLDAAIAGDWKDLKITNNYSTPIYLECYASGGKLYFAVWGQETRPSNRTLRFYSEITESWDDEPVYTDDPNLPLGHEEVTYSGSTGRKSVTYKEVKVDGKVTETIIISKDYYKSSPKLINRGTNPDLVILENGEIVHKDSLPPVEPDVPVDGTVDPDAGTVTE